MADPDWTDPCAVLTWLRPQYYKLAAGQGVVRVVHNGSETAFSDREIGGLETLMRQLESECAAKQGITTGRRRPIIAG